MMTVWKVGVSSLKLYDMSSSVSHHAIFVILSFDFFFKKNVHISVCVWEDALPQDADIMIGRHVDAFN